MVNICRTITFFNNFVPPSEKIQEWEYEALGYYDGISVSENLIKGKFELRQMWDDLAEQASKLTGEYKTQTVHLFRSENGTEVIKDEDFWKERTEKDEYPFLFITMLRLNQKADAVKDLKGKLEKDLKQAEGKSITYLSLDNNDLVVVMRTKAYTQGTTIIDQFHQKQKPIGAGTSPLIYDSFSVCGINKKCLNSPEYQFSDIDGILDKVCLRVIEREPGSISELEEQLKTYCNLKNSNAEDSNSEDSNPGDSNPEDSEEEDRIAYPVLGCEDEVILLENVPAGEFWKLYQDEKGCLSNSNSEFYKKAVMGITSLVLQKKTREDQKILPKAAGEPGMKLPYICEDLLEKCRNLYKNLSGENESYEKMYYKAILQIINSLRKYENMDYMDYTYMTLYEPMKMLIKLIREGKERNQKNVLDGISKFFYAVNLLTQNSVRFERQFIQSVELNARIYEAPVQISTFYVAYFGLLKDILNQPEKDQYNYEIMICPSMMDSLNVQKLLPQTTETDRLLLVEIPENQMYDIKNHLVVMAHEAAHFVGHGIRDRKNRYECMMEAIVKSVAAFLWLDEDMHEYCSEESINHFNSQYLEELKEDAEDYSKEIEKLSRGARKPKDRYYAEYMREDLRISAQKVLLENKSLLDQLGASAFDDRFRGSSPNVEELVPKIEEWRQFRRDFETKKRKFLSRMVMPVDTLSDERSINNIVDGNIHLFKECFADLISILLLELTESEYIDVIWGSVDKIKRADNSGKNLHTDMWRVALVIKVMCKRKMACNFWWEEEELKEQINAGGNRKEFLENVQKILDRYLSGNRSLSELYQEDQDIRTGKRNLDRMYDCEVGEIFCRYLNSCCKIFEENKEKARYDAKGLDRLKEIYGNLKQVGDIEQYIFYLRKVIEEYKEKLFGRFSTASGSQISKGGLL